jgi:MFS transporter, Spinster family, sphingosine-1-phosphate transporter
MLRYAWVVVALLFPVALLNYLDRQLLASMKFSVMADIPTIGDDANWGFMLGQFKWVYAFLSPVGGYLADRFSRRFTISASLFVWSAVTWYTGRVTTFDELLIARTLMGFSEAFYIPAALALIADYHPGVTRSRAVGLHQMAIYCGVISGAFGGYVADEPNLGWRFAFSVCGFLGMAYTIPLLLCLRDAAPSGSDSRVTVTGKIAYRELLTNLSFLLFVLYFTLPALSAWIVRDWMPAVLKLQFGIGQGKAGVAAGVYWQLAAIGGAFLGGYLADRWQRFNPRGRIFVSMIGLSFIVPALFAVGNAPTLEWAVLALMLFGLGWGFYDCNNMPILCQLVRPELRATGYGIMNLVSISCGGFADWWFGFLRVQGFSLNVIFTAFALFVILAMLLVIFIRPKSESLSA